MNRSVLIVTPFFAPQNHSAVFRAHKLAKYLPQFGWKPVVLTVDTQYEYNEDGAMLGDLPSEVEVIRVRYIEPTLRGLRMALGGRNRTFSATKVGKGRASENYTTSARVSIRQKVYRSLLNNWIHAPDSYWTWARKAKRVGKKVLRNRGINLVFTTAPPFSALLVGSALQNAGAKWVADFRDPLAYTQRLSGESVFIHQLQRAIVKNTLQNADAVTIASSCFSSIYFDMFGKRGVDPVFIPTGMDVDVLGPASDDNEKRRPYILFAGEYLTDYDDAFLETFARAVKQTEISRTGIKLLVVGTLELNRARMMPLIQRLKLQEHVEFLDQRPQQEVYKLLRGAVAGLLMPGPRAYWWTTFAKMTDYIGMRKPVLAVVPDPSESRTALTRSGLGIFLDGSSDNRTRILTDFLLGKHALPVRDENECERYTARRQVQTFAEVFDSVSTRKDSPRQ